MSRLLTAVLVLAIAGNGYLAWHLNKQVLPNVVDLEGDLSSVKAERSQNRNASGSDSTRISALDTILADTEAMLEQKRTAVLRFIDLKYVVEGRPLAPSAPSDLAAVEADIRDQRRLLEQTRAEAAKYSGGLVLALIQVRSAIEEETLAALQQRRLAQKYGLTLPARPTRGQSTDDKLAIEEIDKEIEAKQIEILKGETEARGYSGGLALAMIVSRLETEKMTLAMLQQRQLVLKYNIGLPSLGDNLASSGAPKPPGKVVKDKDALQ